MAIRERFCAKCGKKIDSGNFCSDCFEIIIPKKHVNVKQCEHCGAVFYANKKLTKRLEDFIKENFIGEVELNVIPTVCNDCGPKQFKANVQFRGFSSKEIDVSEIERRYSKYIKEFSPNKDGLDIHFTDARMGSELVRKMRNRFNCSFKRTSSLVTQRRDGKKVFRPTFLLRKKEKEEKTGY